MARYKIVDRGPRFLPIVLEAQLIPGSFEHALDILTGPSRAFGCGQDRVDFPPGGAVPAFRHRLAEVSHVQPS